MVSITEPESAPDEGAMPPPKFAPSRNFDLLHTRIEISAIDWQQNSISARATVTFTPFVDDLDRIVLDAGNMTILAVRTPAGDSLRFDYDPKAEKLTVYLGKSYNYDDTVSVAVRYIAHSKQKGIFFIKPDSLDSTRPLQIWTQGEPEDNHYWFPTFDDPIERMTSEVIVTVTDTLETLSNGRLVSQQRNPDGTRTDHWLQDKPHAPYLVMLAVGDYAIVEDEWDGLPLQYYVYPKDEQYADMVFGLTPDMLSFFSDKLGVRYPWDKYAQVIVTDFTAGAMENTTATVMAERVMHDERAHIDDQSLDIIAHELAHHWFGNLVTAKSWAEIFLNESLASYFEVLYLEHAKGRDEAMMHLLNQRRVYLAVAERTGQRPMLFRNYEDPDRLFDVFSYQKGSNLIHMLRYVLGDDGFWRSLRTYLERNRYRWVDLDDLQDAVLEATGQNLQWFFDQWFVKQGHPKFKVTKDWDAESGILTLTVLQTQEVGDKVPLFRMPVDIEVVTEQGAQAYRVWVDSTAHEFAFRPAGEPKMIIFDKGNWILKELDFPRSKGELIYQLAYADDISHRIEAASLLKTYAMPADSSVQRALVDALASDPFWGVRRQAAETLRLFGTDIAERALEAALADPSSKVRATAVEALGRSGYVQALPLIERVMQSDSSYRVVAAAIRAVGRLDSTGAFDKIAPMMEQNSYQEIIRRTTLLVFRNLGDRRAIPIAQEYASRGHNRFLRLTAINTLTSLATEADTTVVDQLIEMIRDPYRQAQLFAIRGLGSLGAERALDPLRKFFIETKDRRLMNMASQAIERIEARMAERQAEQSGANQN
jgi:aminopeptidase N